MPDEDSYRLAFDVAQVAAEQVVYIEAHPTFVRAAVRVIHTDEEWMIANPVCAFWALRLKWKKHA